jgi:hypothetical protein
MAIVTKSIEPQPGGYITLQGGSDTIIINQITVPEWVHDGFKLMIDFDQTNIGAGVYLKCIDGPGGSQNLRLIPFGFNKNNVSLDSSLIFGKDSIDYLIEAVNELITAGPNAAARLASASICNNEGLKKTLAWHETRGQATIAGIKGSGPLQGFDYDFMYPIFTFVYDANMSVWKQTAMAFNNYS